MAAMLKALWQRLTAGGGAPDAAPIEYNGYLIRPTPYARGSGYQTCGVITKEVAGETREHRFIRAETHPNLAGAVEFSLAKARQLIDEQGDRLFGQSEGGRDGL
jgi:hypothetical protein